MAKNGGYKSKLLEDLKSLSEERIKALADFAAYLREREEWEATAEILGSKAMVSQIRKSRRAWVEGRKEEFVSLAELKAKPFPKRVIARRGATWQSQTDEHLPR